MTSGSCRKIERSECGERQPDLRVDLNLVDAFELVFDRVFGRDDLGLVAFDFEQRAVERRRFAGAGRAGHEDDAVRQANQLAEAIVQVRLHAERFERELHPALVEETHHDAFAVEHRDDRNADVDLAAGDAELDAAVLRQPLLGDVEPGHDLEPADDRGLEAVDLGRHRLRVQHAVDAVADLDARGLRLDVDVARPRSTASSRISFTSRMTDASWAFGQFGVDRCLRAARSLPSSSCWASKPSIVSLPTPRCVLICRAICARGARTGSIVSPVVALNSSSG